MSAVRVPTGRVRGSAPAAGLVVLALLAVGGLLVAGRLNAAATPSDSGLREAGPLVEALLPVGRTWLDVATFATMGCLLAAGWLLPAGAGVLEATRHQLLRLAGGWALAWSAAAAVLAVATTAQLVGTGAGDVLTSPALYPLLWEVPQNLALLVVAVVGLVVHRCSVRLRGAGAARVLLVAVSLALVPMLMSGHAKTSSNHYLAAQSLVVHVIAASVWVGGLLVLVIHLRKDVAVLRHALPRFSTVALCCFVAVAVSGAAGAWLRLGLEWNAWTSSYGVLVLAKTAALVLLGVLGAAHRSRSLPQLVAGRRLAFTRFATVEAVVMGSAAALAVVLARTSPPIDALSRAVPQHATTFPTVDRTIDPVGPWNLLTEVRPDALVLSMAAAALAGYLLAVRHLVRSGGAWPAGRTASFVTGIVVAAWCMCGGLGSYSGALFSADLVRLLTMGLVVPALLTLGTPVQLAWGSRPGPARVARFLDPVNGLVLLVLLLAGVVLTPLLEVSLRTPVLHTALPLAALAAGMLFLGPLLAVDVPWRQRGATTDARLLVTVLGVLLLVYAGHIYTSVPIVADDWFGRLGLEWGDPAADQRHAAWWVAGFGLTLLVAAQLLARRTRAAQVQPGVPTRSGSPLSPVKDRT